MGRFLPPDHSQGDESTVGGYRAVHARPAAFEGVDGLSYSVEVEADATGDAEHPIGGYLLFVQWARGMPTVTGHLETDFLAYGTSEHAVREQVGALPLAEAKRLLDECIRSRGAPPGSTQSRPWWEAMRDADDERDA
ncbi:MAG TPA: hypothetical protein VFW98_14665 [Gemmatimonadaceae bacterium]|nr:hypothetical protein [Gemmatimonadaceae bacterium]